MGNFFKTLLAIGIGLMIGKWLAIELMVVTILVVNYFK
jgi:hypothetical protein